MKQWRFEVFNRADTSDVHGGGVLEDIRELGINSVEAVQSARVFLNSDFAWGYSSSKQISIRILQSVSQRNC